MGAKTNRIQRVELGFDGLVLHCPFCGSVVFNTEAIQDDWLTPCLHTLFVADDNNLLRRSGRFDALMHISGIQTKDIEFGDGFTDGFTDKVCCPDAVKFAIHLPPPSGFGFYIGFAPVESD